MYLHFKTFLDRIPNLIYLIQFTKYVSHLSKQIRITYCFAFVESPMIRHTPVTLDTLYSFETFAFSVDMVAFFSAFSVTVTIYNAKMI